MSSFVQILCLFALFCLSNGSSFHKFHSGECPQIDSMPDFNIDQFLGEWFVIQNSNDNVAACLREEFSVIEETAKEMFDMARNELENTSNSKEVEKNTNKVYQLKRSYLPFGGRQFICESGKIQFVSNKSKSEMEVNLPYTETGMLNLKHYQVIGTDYNNYALVWRCQRTIFGHRRTAQIMSRKATMDPHTLEELKPMMRHFEAENDIKFSEVRQVNCHETPLESEVTNKPKVTAEIPVSKRPDDIQKVTDIIDQKLSSNGKNKKKLISIDVGGFHLSISLPFW